MVKNYALLFCILLVMQLGYEGHAKDFPSIAANSYMVMDASSGAILQELDAYNPLPPASMTKMMTALIILDQIHSGRIGWEQMVPVQKRAAKIGHARVSLRAGRKETVRNLFEAMLVCSANNATVSLAEYVAGTEEAFVALMNQKAKELGMVGTHYSNTTGLDRSLYLYPPDTVGPHVMSAYDTATLCRELVTRYPEVLTITSMPSLEFRQKVYPSSNLMLKKGKLYYLGVDGMKTGYTDEAGYCFSATAKRDCLRLVTVVMGASSNEQRFIQTKKLLNFGFDMFEGKTLTTYDLDKKELDIPTGVEQTLSVRLTKPLIMAIHKGEKKFYTMKLIPDSKIKAPLSKGAIVGKAIVMYRGTPIKGCKPINVVAKQDVHKANLLCQLYRIIRGWIVVCFP